MSKTHLILVDLGLEHLNRESDIIPFAIKRTADYLHIAFDCRYVQELILGSNHPDKILKLLEQCREAQQQQINQYLNYLNEELGDSFSKIVTTLAN